ncbi:iron chelate uptake ABC transporter family permease subunit [Ancylobacter oerskovii]|uniref:Iron chelate uptake ABC transporter family permease subunit n=1 Tax=Ancylobacter oerskovii TaxID=459519 RepID=A0ABW4YYJ4_9HYPH|nr:iron chelate uptake ABC transporter family permease subunit [Ancylobacter oerskovii]MBS7541794.1 iron chelate uptake ABC transporter family permease subunit [Ancylobacter oerskovii]
MSLILIGAFALASMAGRDAEGWRIDAWSDAVLLWPWRGPRLLAAFGSGAMLGCAGALMQRLTRNPMASPEMLGISPGAAIAVILAMMWFPRLNTGWVSILAFAGAFAAVSTLVTISLRTGFTSERLLLTGIAIGSVSMALCAMVLATGDPRSTLLLSWMAESTYRITQAEAYVVVAMAALVSLASLPLVRSLEILGLGEPGAKALGVALTPIRLAIVVLAAAATATLSVGPLSFVGLAGPHMARLFGFRRIAGHLLASAAFGGLVMMIADWIGRTVLFPLEIPAGGVASLIGGPYVLWLMRRR